MFSWKTKLKMVPKIHHNQAKLLDNTIKFQMEHFLSFLFLNYLFDISE